MILINLLPQELRKKETPKIVMPEIPIKKTLIVIGISLAALQVLLSLAAIFFSMREAGVKHLYLTHISRRYRERDGLLFHLWR